MGTLRKTKSGEGSSHLPDGWREVKLGDVGKITTGKTPSEKYPADWGDKMLFVTPSDYKNYGKFAYSTDRKLSDEGINRLRNKILSPKSVMVTCIGYMGKVAINKFQAVTNQQINSITPYPRVVDSDFLYYFLASIYNLLQKRYGTAGTAVPIINKGDFEQIDTFLPPLHEQKSIAEVLSSLDDKIDLLHRQNKTLEDMAQTLFRQWFVEEADEGWDEKPLGETVDISIGRTPPRKEFHWFSKNKRDWKWISIKDMAESGVYFFNTSEYLTQDAVEKFNIPIIPKNTVILSFKMTVGRVGITTTDMLSNEAIAQFKINSGTQFTKEYLYFYLKTFRFESLGSTSSIVTSINTAMIKSIIIAVPDSRLIERFENFCKPVFKKIYSNKSHIHTIENLRDILLPKLVNGEMRVNYE